MSNLVINSNRISELQNGLPKSNPFQYRTTSYPNGFKWTEEVLPRTPMTGIYNRDVFFDIPRKGLLTKCVLKMAMSCSGDNTAVKDRLGNHVFSKVELRTLNGAKKIQTIIPEYQDIRMDEEVSNRVARSTFPDVTFSANSIVCYCPLYLWLSQSYDKHLDTSFVEDLELFVRTGESYTEFGLASELDTFTMTLLCSYVEADVFWGPKTILAYDIFSENSAVVTSTSDTIVLSSDKDVFATHCCLVKDRYLLAIDSFTLESSSFKMVDIDNRINAISTGWVEDFEVKNGNQFLTYYWGLSNNRDINTMCCNFRDLPPVSFTINYGNTYTGYTRKTFSEYWCSIQIDRFGRIRKSG